MNNESWINNDKLKNWIMMKSWINVELNNEWIMKVELNMKLMIKYWIE